jgi:chromate transporter
VRLAAPLTAITAAVVGVILNLALLFAVHVLWPQGSGARFDWAALLIGGVGLLALIRFKLGVPTLIGASAVVGLLLQSLAR